LIHVFPFGIGTTLVHFHILGNVPFLIQTLRTFVFDGAIEHVVAFSMQAEMLSGSLALALSKAPQLHPHYTKGQQGTDQGPQGTCQGPVCLIVLD